MYKIKTKTKEECKIEDNVFIVTGDSYNIPCSIIEKIEKDINKSFKELQLEDIDGVIKSILKLNEQLYALIYLVDHNFTLCPDEEEYDNNKIIRKIVSHKAFKKFHTPILTLLKISMDVNEDGDCGEFEPTEKELRMIEKFENKNNIQIYIEV